MVLGEEDEGAWGIMVFSLIFSEEYAKKVMGRLIGDVLQ
jgi:hypothetical protein